MSEHNWKEVVVDTDTDIWDVREAKDGDHIEGKLTNIENDIGPKKSKLYTFATEKGDVKVWGSTVLNDRLMGIPTGTYVKVEYTGKTRSKTGNDYHTYKVFIDEDSVPDEDSAPRVSGYETARAQANALKAKDIEGEPIPLDEMPPDFLT